jgi:hypothetical protein
MSQDTEDQLAGAMNARRFLMGTGSGFRWRQAGCAHVIEHLADLCCQQMDVNGFARNAASESSTPL